MKTIEELRASLAAILHADGVNLKLYLGTGEGDTRAYWLADFDDDAAELVCPQFVQSVDRFLSNEDLETRLLTLMDHRADTLFMYDLKEQPSEFARVGALITGSEPELFKFADHDLSTVTSLVIKISSAQRSVVFYKKFYPVSLVKRDQILLVIKASTRFALLDQDILKVTGGFEVLWLDGEVYINDFGKFEKSFSFDKIAKDAMKEVADRIVALDLVNDEKGYLALGLASRKDILRAGSSRVLNMEVAVIVAFVKARQPQIGIKVVNGKLLLSSKASVKRLYKLMNDDYLISELTHVEYEILAKNELEVTPTTV